MSNPNLEAGIIYTAIGVVGMTTGFVPLTIISGVVAIFGISMLF